MNIEHLIRNALDDPASPIEKLHSLLDRIDVVLEDALTLNNSARRPPPSVVAQANGCTQQEID